MTNTRRHYVDGSEAVIILLAPALSLIALAAGALATVVGIVLNGPRAMRRRPDQPFVVLPPVPTPGMLKQSSETDEPAHAV